MKKGYARLKEVALLFIKLGIIGFGGPIVHIAMMEEEVVRKRKWVSQQHFLDLVGATNLIPGPNSTEMAMHCGRERAGWKGLVVAGACFILPAVLITLAFAWAYDRYGKLPEVENFIYGIKPAIIAVVASAAISLGKKALKSAFLGILGVISAVVVLLGANEILVLFGAGAIGILYHSLKSKNRSLNGFLPITLLQVDVSSWNVFWIFLKVGSILYGSGYVLFAFLDAELVARGFISKTQLADAIAVGQFTPGPVFSAATFIGYQVGGFNGAILATIGIFLPSFLFVGLLNPLIPRLRKSPVMSAFLDAVNIASVAIILAVLVEMSRIMIADWRTIVIALLSFLVMFYFKKVNSAIVVIGGALLGFILKQV
jgi:chromate transporter